MLIQEMIIRDIIWQWINWRDAWRDQQIWKNNQSWLRVPVQVVR